MFFLEGCRKRLGAGGVAYDLACADALDHTVLRRLLRRVQTVSGDKPRKLQPSEQLVQCVLVIWPHKAVFRRKFDRRFAADRRQIVGQIRAVPPLFELGTQLFLDRVQMCVHAVQRAVVQQQLRRRLRADARNAGDII